MSLRSMSDTSWKCKYNCDLSKGACEHLEALLPGEDSGQFHDNRFGPETKRARIIYVDDLQRLENQMQLYTTGNTEVEISQFNALIEKVDLSELEKGVLYDRYVRGYTQKRIAEDRNFTNQSARLVSRFLSKLHTKLRKALINE